MKELPEADSYLTRFSDKLQPMIEAVKDIGRRTFIAQAAAVVALTGCKSVEGKAGPAPMVSFKPSTKKPVKRSPRQLMRECNVRKMYMPESSELRRRASGMNARFITVHNTANKNADAMQHARALNNGVLRCNWHFTVDPYITIQHLPLDETGKHADRGGPGDKYSIGIEMCEKRGQSLAKTFDRTAKLCAWLMYKEGIPLRNVVPHYYWTGKQCPRHLLDNGRPGYKWSWFISRVDYYYRCIS